MKRRVNVDVLLWDTVDGKKIPQQIRWVEEGEYYGAIYDVAVRGKPIRAASMAGGVGWRYECLISEKPSYLYFEDPLWFVEAK